jgi:hypothetical protein
VEALTPAPSRVTNTPPVIGSVTVTPGLYVQTNVDMTVTVDCSDPDGDSVTVSVDYNGDGTQDDSQPCTSNTAVFTLTGGYATAGIYCFKICASDGVGSDPCLFGTILCGEKKKRDVSTYGVLITVTAPPNSPPISYGIIVSPGSTVNTNTPLTFTVDCSDLDGDSVTVYADFDGDGSVNDSQPCVVGAAGGRAVFTLANGYTQPGIYCFKACLDDGVGSATCDFSAILCGSKRDVTGTSVLVFVSAANNPPVIGPGGISVLPSTTVDVNVPVTVTVSCLDPDFDPVTVSADFNEDGSPDSQARCISGTATLQYSGYSRRGTFCLKVCLNDNVGPETCNFGNIRCAAVPSAKRAVTGAGLIVTVGNSGGGDPYFLGIHMARYLSST